jgi:ribosomal protein L1
MYTTEKRKRSSCENCFDFYVRLRHVPRPKMKICVLGDQIHCDQAKANNLPCMTADDLKKLNKDKKLIKKLGTQFVKFLLRLENRDVSKLCTGVYLLFHLPTHFSCQ